MTRITILKILHLILLIISASVFVFNFPILTIEDFVLATVIAICLIASGYIDRIIDEEEGDL